MALAFITAAAVGLCQVLIDIFLSVAIFAGKIVKSAVSLLIKFAVYGFFIWLVFKLFKLYIAGVAAGFALGFFPALIIYCIIKLKK